MIEHALLHVHLDDRPDLALARLATLRPERVTVLLDPGREPPADWGTADDTESARLRVTLTHLLARAEAAGGGVPVAGIVGGAEAVAELRYDALVSVPASLAA